MRAFLAIVACLALVPGCSDGPAAPDSPSGIGTLVVTGGIAIANDGGLDRYFILFEEETAALVDLNFNPEAEEHWIQIRAGESRLVPWSDVHGFHAGARAVVIHSWTGSRAIPVGGGVQWVGEGFVTWTVEL